MRDGWVEYKFKDVATAVKGKLPKTKNEDGIGIPYLTANFLRSSKPDYWIENIEGAVTAEDGDCLILWDGAGAGDLFSAQRGVVSSTMAVVTTQNSKILREFLTLFISSKADYIKETCRGTTVPHVSPDAIANMDLKIPPLPEQKRIVDLISSVDSYIEALQHQLENAKRSRSAVLHELMSQALDENRKPLIELAKLQRGHDLPTQDRIEGSIPVVASNGVVGFHNTHKAIGPGVVTGRSGTIGKVIYIDDDYWPLNTTLYVIDFKGNLPKFVALVLETLKLENYAGGSTVPSLDRNVLSQVPVPYPSIKEQERIVGIIQSLDEVVTKSEHAISQAKILRTGLLSDLLSSTHEIPASYDKVIGAA